MAGGFICGGLLVPVCLQDWNIASVDSFRHPWDIEPNEETNAGSHRKDPRRDPGRKNSRAMQQADRAATPETQGRSHAALLLTSEEHLRGTNFERLTLSPSL